MTIGLYFILVMFMYLTAWHFSKRRAMRFNLKGQLMILLTASIGAFVFSVHEQFIWCLLVFASYTDIIDQTVYYKVSYACIGIELILMLVIRSYSVYPLYTIILPICIVICMGLIRAVASGDIDIFFLIILYAYNDGLRATGYTIAFIFISGVCFLFYMFVIDIVRAIKGKKVMRRGAFVPAMACAFLLIHYISNVLPKL